MRAGGSEREESGEVGHTFSFGVEILFLVAREFCFTVEFGKQRNHALTPVGASALELQPEVGNSLGSYAHLAGSKEMEA